MGPLAPIRDHWPAAEAVYGIDTPTGGKDALPEYRGSPLYSPPNRPGHPNDAFVTYFDVFVDQAQSES